jgi:hypothetical protein
LNAPAKYERLRRENDKLGAGIDTIWGVLPGGKVEIQALRFDSAKFSVAQLRAWLSEHKMSGTIEPAAKEASLSYGNFMARWMESKGAARQFPNTEARWIAGRMKWRGSPQRKTGS